MHVVVPVKEEDKEEGEGEGEGEEERCFGALLELALDEAAKADEA
jgi:hypothetical protein